MCMLACYADVRRLTELLNQLLTLSLAFIWPLFNQERSIEIKNISCKSFLARSLSYSYQKTCHKSDLNVTGMLLYWRRCKGTLQMSTLSSEWTALLKTGNGWNHFYGKKLDQLCWLIQRRRPRASICASWTRKWLNGALRRHWALREYSALYPSTQRDSSCAGMPGVVIVGYGSRRQECLADLELI